MKVVDSGHDFSVLNFDLVFSRVAERIYMGSSYTRKFEATQHFEARNQLTGACGASGVCSWGLKPELAPYAIQQMEVA